MVYQLTIRILHHSYIANPSYRDDLKLAFDVKIDEMIKLMDGHIRQMHAKYPGDNIVGSLSSLCDLETAMLIF